MRLHCERKRLVQQPQTNSLVAPTILQSPIISLLCLSCPQDHPYYHPSFIPCLMVKPQFLWGICTPALLKGSSFHCPSGAKPRSPLLHDSSKDSSRVTLVQRSSSQICLGHQRFFRLAPHKPGTLQPCGNQSSWQALLQTGGLQPPQYVASNKQM